MTKDNSKIWTLELLVQETFIRHNFFIGDCEWIACSGQVQMNLFLRNHKQNTAVFVISLQMETLAGSVKLHSNAQLSPTQSLMPVKTSREVRNLWNCYCEETFDTVIAGRKITSLYTRAILHEIGKQMHQIAFGGTNYASSNYIWHWQLPSP